MALTKIRGNTQILDQSINNAQIANKGPGNETGIQLAKIEDGDLLVKSDGSVSFSAPISGVTPTEADHLVTKAYVDASAQGLDVKESARAVSSVNVVLSGLQTIDGVALVDGDRILVANQTNPVENGIYTVHTGGWTRAADATTNEQVTPGLFTFVEEGNVGAGTGWVLTSTGPTTLGTTPLPFAQFSSAGVIQAGNGITKTGNSISVRSANGGIAVGATGIELKTDGTTLTVGANGIKLADLATGQVLIGSSAGVATARTISGDITIDEAGVARISAGAVGAATIGDNSLAPSKLQHGTAGQVLMAGADGTATYTTLTGDVTVNASGLTALANNTVNTEELVDGAVTLAKLAALPVGQILIGTADGNATVTLSGDVLIDATGAVTVNPATVVRVQDMVNREVPAGLINGTNDTFTLAGTPRAGTECVYVNGLLQDSGTGNDYTISGNTITMLYTLSAGDKLRVSYFK